VLVLVLAFALGLLFGKLHEAGIRAPRKAADVERLETLRSSGALCYSMVADHWTRSHTRVRGSADIAAAAADIRDDLDGPTWRNR